MSEHLFKYLGEEREAKKVVRKKDEELKLVLKVEILRKVKGSKIEKSKSWNKNYVNSKVQFCTADRFIENQTL